MDVPLGPISRMPLPSDRKSIAALHTSAGLLPNYRDASSSESRRWSNKPTIIPSPGSQPVRQQGKNPFDGGRLKDTLSGSRSKQKIGNVVSSRTPLPSMSELPVAKRQRLEHGTRANREFVSQMGKGPTNAIYVDEDLGEPVMKPRSPTISPPTHPFNDTYKAKTDGVSTAAVRKRLLERSNQIEVMDVSESDAIESAGQFDDELNIQSTKPGASTISVSTISAPQGNVRGKIELYNKPKFVDLADEGRKKGKMQGKFPSKIIQRNANFERDAIATSSSDFNHGEQWFSLPIEAWHFGTKRFPDKNLNQDPGYSLQWDEKSKSPWLYAKLGSLGNLAKYNAQFRLDREIESVQYTREPTQPHDLIILHLMTTPITGKLIKPTLPCEGHFKPGASDAGKLTFKLLSNHSDWSQTKYQKLVTYLRKNVNEFTILDPHASRSLWEAADGPTTCRKRKQMHPSLEPPSRLQTDSNRLSSASRDDHATASASGSEAVFEDAATFQATLERPERESRHFTNPQSKMSQTSKPSLRTPAILPASRPKPTPAYKDASKDVAESSELRRSTRQPKPQSAPLADPDELMLVYPPDTAGALNITNADLGRLQPNEFLNDTLIEFGLKLWLNQLRVTKPELAESIHVFSSFFYKKLNNKNLAEGYQSVRKWTSKIDLFKKKYIIIPINEHLHWYLAVIYHPEHVLSPSPYQAPRLSVTTRGRAAQVGQEPTKCILAKSPPPQGAPDEIMSDPSPHTLSDLQHDEEVSALLHVCSISQAEDSGNEQSMLLSSPSAPEGNAEEPIIVTPEANAVDDTLSDNVILQYPSSDTMDIDAPQIAPRSPSSKPSLMHKPGVRRRGTSTEPESIHSDSSVGKSVAKRRVVVSGNGPATVFDGGVAAVNFYGSVPSKGKRKASPYPLKSQNEAEQEPKVDELFSSPEHIKTAERPVTYIFTLDSLGTKHPQAIKVLKQYLSMEAKDKKGIEESSEAKGKQALVPVQPNYCDCGLYLLHFAETFMKDPDFYCHIILTRKASSHISERQKDWDDADVGGLREKLTATVVGLSEQWKRDRAAKVSMGSKEGERVESSDDDVDIVEDLERPVAPASKGKGKGKASYSKTKPLSKAMRMR